MSPLAFTLYTALLAVSFALCAVIALPATIGPAVAMIFGGAP